MKRIYIAGAISGHNPKNVETKFGAAEVLLKEKGYSPFNPFFYIQETNKIFRAIGKAELTDENPDTRKQIMKICFSELMNCEAIYLLHDWQTSEGAQMEKKLADMLGIPALLLKD